MHTATCVPGARPWKGPGIAGDPAPQQAVALQGQTSGVSDAIDLTTTNILLGILAAVSLLEAAAVLGIFVAGALLFRRVMHVISGIEERQVTPAVTRVNAILDDVKGVTSTVKNEAERVDRVMQMAADFAGRCRTRDAVPHTPS